MNEAVMFAYRAVRDSHGPWSADRIIADPELNAAFVGECRKADSESTTFQLNWCLLNLRKKGELAAFGKSQRTIIKDQDDFRFAAEMAARFLERREGVTLDAILCDPARASEFDELASRLAPGRSSLEYRWSALTLRKTKRLSPELVARALGAVSVTSHCVREIDVATIVDDGGIYVFFDTTETLYVGETHNLRLRLKKHLDHSDRKGLARWMWEYGTDSLFVELHALTSSTKEIRRALEEELIRSRRPIFNIQRS